jgi:4-alpha-glucanotransferase
VASDADDRTVNDRGQTLFGARSSGVLLHPTSLPAGVLGADAYRFVDWLAAAGQQWWQVLPLGPPDEYGSPYASASAFAGWAELLARPNARVTRLESKDFRARHADWVDDWAAYAGGSAVEDQVRFEREWSALRRHAASRGVRIIGDLPLYVGGESCDVTSRPELFDHSVVAGVPPDLFTATGQLWGNPCFDWPAHRAEGYRWWTARFRRSQEVGDAVRLDHFRGFVAYWAVPSGAPTAMGGRWRRGPGPALFRAAEAELGRLPVIAEDLGVITPAVDRLRELIGAPSMRILQFGFGDSNNRNALSRHVEDCVVYTGTHDNDPIAAWWHSVPATIRDEASRQLREAGITEADPAWALIELTFTSRARVALVQMQDVLGLGREARMNLPGTVDGNWSWRLDRRSLTAELAARLRGVTARTGRLPRGPARRRPRRSPPASARR